MEVRNLRLGNWVLDRESPYIYQVARIETKEYSAWNSGDDHNIVVKIEGSEEGYFEMRPSGIPLSENYLLRLGFAGNLYEDRYEIEDFHIHCDKTKANLDLWVTNCRMDLKYVHQLQNLFFALTGKELELK